MTQPSTVIHLSDVSKQYRSELGQKKVKALAGLSFSVFQGEVFGIVGPNGAGKSTTLKILLGFIRPDTGNVTLHNLAPSTPAARAFVGYLPETPSLYDNLTIIDHLRFAGRLAGMKAKEIDGKINSLLALVDLGHAGKTPLRRYSKGMTQRAALAFALFREPEILVLDEPMSGLDPLGRQLVVDIIRDYNRAGNTVLFCSHILSDVERICDRIAIMNKGRLAATIKPTELEQQPFDSVLNEGKSPLESFFLQTIAAAQS